MPQRSRTWEYRPIEGVWRRGSRRACQTRLAVSKLIMSEDARSARPQVVATGCRCMNVSTAPHASVSRCSSAARLAAEHDPAEAHLGIDRKDQLRKLRLTDASIERRAQFGELRILVLRRERREVQLVVDAKRTSLRGGGHSRHPCLGTLSERFEECHSVGR